MYELVIFKVIDDGYETVIPACLINVALCFCFCSFYTIGWATGRVG